MVEEKLPVNLGKPKRRRKPKAAAKTVPKVQPDISPPAASHAPGQTFHPEAPRMPEPLSEPVEAPDVLDLPRHSGKLPIARQGSMGKKLAKDLLWLLVFLLVVAGGGLAAIYFLKI